MKITFHSAVLFVKDIEIAKAFYTSILKMKIKEDLGVSVALENGLSIWQIPAYHELNKFSNLADYKNKVHELYFETDEIDHFNNLLVKDNIPLVHPLKTESWGQKTIRFFDPDGHIVEVGEPLEIFVRRMSKEGQNIDELHKTTGIPKNQIENFLST